MKREGMIYFVLLRSVAQENHNSTCEENYFHSHDTFQASLCFDNLFSVKLPFLSSTLVFPG